MLEPVFSVSEFNEMINSHLGVLGEVTVEGELSEFKISHGKWIYATLKDAGASVGLFGMTFKVRNYHSLDLGMLVKVKGIPGLYLRSGRFSLNVTEITPSGEGALLAAYAKLRAQLDQEGLFAPERKRPLPMFPERVGLLTAAGSQAYQDFVKVAGVRTGGVKIYFYPVQVQGTGAADSVIRGLRYFNEHHPVDLIVLTRGGGSLEDLIAFNDEQLVRAVFASQIPTVCAIGHEGDVALAELAADLRASTPSNAAELVFRDRRAVLRELRGHTDYLTMMINSRLSDIQKDSLRSLDVISHFLDHSFAEMSSTLQSFRAHLTQSADRITSLALAVSQQETLISKSLNSWFHIFSERIAHLQSQLLALDPTRLLSRGFSILQDSSGQIIRSVDQLNIGDPLVALLADGRVESKIINKVKESHEK